jgi:hypothetical protein
MTKRRRPTAQHLARQDNTERHHTTILDAVDDPHLFGEHFKDGSTWAAWRVFLAALFGLPMTKAQLAIYQKHTGRNKPPSEPLHEAWLICGRRAGKSFILALIAVYLACFKDWRSMLVPMRGRARGQKHV